jgi:hypothetical protein
MSERENLMTAETVRSILDYDPGTGVFKWKWRNDVPKRTNARWAGTVAGHVNNQRYRQIKIKSRHYQAHRLAWLIVHGEWPPNDLDHRDGDKLNNRIANLRLATRQENMRNVGLQANTTTGVTGVYWHKGDRKFVAQITVDYRLINLGRFPTIEEATAARAAAETEHFGEFRRAA